MMAVGLELGKMIVGPQGHQGYLALTGLSGLHHSPGARVLGARSMEARHPSLPRLGRPNRARHHVVALSHLMVLALTAGAARVVELRRIAAG